MLTALFFCLGIWAGTYLVPAPPVLDAPVGPFAQLQPASGTDESARWIAAPRTAVSVSSSSQWTPNVQLLVDLARMPGARHAHDRAADDVTRSTPSGSPHLRRIPLLI